MESLSNYLAFENKIKMVDPLPWRQQIIWFYAMKNLAELINRKLQIKRNFAINRLKLPFCESFIT